MIRIRIQEEKMPLPTKNNKHRREHLNLPPTHYRHREFIRRGWSKAFKDIKNPEYD